MEFVTSIGMEVHVELSTATKMFCRCPVAFGGEPNTRVCPVCLGLPGALPLINRRAVEMVLMTALALDCEIARTSVFHRKNYFYPDLPKGYQISQYEETNPIGYHGRLEIPVPGGTKTVRIRRVHLEEDTGKLFHDGMQTGIDYNRAGTPLMEIVTDFPPDLESAEEAREYLVQLREILVALGVTDGKMEQGSLRCEPNISIRPVGSDRYGTKTELKNLNSFRSVRLGIDYEARRQAAIVLSGGSVPQETRGWNEATETSFPMRSKEEEQDYRYFVDPDLPPLRFTEEEIESLRARLPELPNERLVRYRRDFGLSEYDARLLVGERAWSEFFERAVALGAEPKAVCNWMQSDLARWLNETGESLEEVSRARLRPEHLVDLLGLLSRGVISGKMAKSIFAEAYRSGEMPSEIVKRSGAAQITDLDELRTIVARVLEQNPDAAERARSGRKNVVDFLVGQVMRETRGRANPPLVARLLEEMLS